MADTAHSPDSEYMTEYFEEEELLIQHGKKLANMIRDAKHFVAFTGAGISTACGIPDFRSPNGVWTLQAKEKVLLLLFLLPKLFLLSLT